MSGDDLPFIQEYARFHGLTRNHLELDPLQGLRTPDNHLQLLKDLPEPFHIDASNATVPAERMFFDADTASLLASIVPSSNEHIPRFDQVVDIDIHRFRDLKLEPPLLRTDHEWDMQHFARQVQPDLKNEFLPLESIDEEADEGLTWPTKFHRLPEELWQKARSEKLEISSEDLLYLKQNLHDHVGDGSHVSFEEADLTYQRNTSVAPISPPLLPMSPEIRPFVPSVEASSLDLLSDQTSPTREEAQELERTIFKDDGILLAKKREQPRLDPTLRDSIHLSDISLLRDIEDPPSSPLSLRKIKCDLRIEIPLSPASSDHVPPWDKREVSCSEVWTGLIVKLPSPIPESQEQSLNDIDTLYEEMVPFARKAERIIEQEQLQEADTTLREPVPALDSSLPDPPWKVVCGNPSNAGSELLSDMQTIHFWPLSAKVEEKMSWVPFPTALGRVNIQESIEDDGSTIEYTVQPQAVDDESLIWKRDGLRILDEVHDFHEQLEDGEFPDEKDMRSLMRKRKLELESDAEDRACSAFEINHRNHQENKHLRIHSKDGLVNFTALGDFINNRKGKFEPTPPAPFRDRPRLDALNNSRQVQDSTERESENLHELSLPNIEYPIPPYSPPDGSRQFIVSTSFLGQRRLVRRILQLYPQAEFIERGCTFHSTKTMDAQLFRPATTQTPLNGTTEEADINLSPSEGLLWTTIQKIKQWPLPGQLSRSGIRDRIVKTARRYETLFVLVSEDKSPSTGTTRNSLHINDCEALSELTAFCMSLEEEVQTILVPGGEEELAKWMVALMARNGVKNAEIKLLQEETSWEGFLRTAGMNAFAAQAVISGLKAPEQKDLDSRAHGLAAFVTMSMKERFARFETIFGGRKMLARVGKVLDSKW